MSSFSDMDVEQLRKSLKIKREKVKLFKNPLLTLYHFGHVIIDSAISYNSILISSTLVTLLVVILLTWYLPDSIFGEFAEHKSLFREHSEFVIWWVVLGVLSSVGLGSGLHTFVLFLGPYIIRIAVTASMCNTTDFNTSIHWFRSGNLFNLISHPEHAFECVPVTDGEPLSLYAILLKVQYPSLLWGLGTAIGELPPYFVARAARLKGERLNELEDSLAEHEGESHILHQLKEKVFQYIQNFGFWAIMLFASIPNPLFDLAGLTCGHFLVPFWTFFGATVVGKAIVKTHIQSFAYIVMFNRRTFNSIETFIMNRIPSLDFIVHMMATAVGNIAYKSCSNKDIYPTVQDCDKCCNRMLEREARIQACVSKCEVVEEEDELSWGRLAWQFFLISMISYFIYTLIDTSVQHHLQTRDEITIAKFEKDFGRPTLKMDKSQGKAFSASPSPTKRKHRGSNGRVLRAHSKSSSASPQVSRKKSTKRKVE